MPISSAVLDTGAATLTVSGTETSSILRIRLFEGAVTTNFLDITPQRPPGTAAGQSWSWTQVIRDSDVLGGHTLAELQSKCGQSITFKYATTGHLEFPPSVTVVMDCGPGCPAITLAVERFATPCDGNGHWHLRVHTDVPESRPGHFEWAIDGVPQGSERLSQTPAMGGVRRLILDRNIATGSSPTTVAVSLTLSSDDNDCPYSIDVPVGVCRVQCPEDVHLVRIKVVDAAGNDRSSDACLPAGHYTLEVEWDNPMLPPGRYEWHRNNGPVDSTLTGASPTIEHGDTDESFQVRYVQDNGCDYVQSIELKACAGCPQLDDIDVSVARSCDNGKRTVTITASVTPQGAATQGASLILVKPDGTNDTVDSQSSSSPFVLTMNRALDPGSYSAHVETDVAGCAGKDKPFEVPTCPGSGGGGGTTSDGRIPWCFLFRLFALLGAAAIALGLLLLCPGLTTIDARLQYGAAAVLIVVGVIVLIVALILWRLLCMPDCCQWKLMLAELLLIVGFILFYALFCPCVYIGIAGMAAIAAGVGVFVWWVMTCGPTPCYLLDELLLTFVIIDLVVAVLNVIMAFIGACPLAWWRAVHGAIISAISAAIIFQMRRFGCRV